MTINEARTLANIAPRAKSITADYHCTVLPDSVLVTRNGEPTRSSEVKDGTCKCPSYVENGTCKHLLGLPALINAEIIRLGEVLTVLDSENGREALRSAREILDAHLCEMDVQTYRANITRSMDFV